jgi:hypothetical protein
MNVDGAKSVHNSMGTIHMKSLLHQDLAHTHSQHPHPRLTING